jgi:hypothetical protein
MQHFTNRITIAFHLIHGLTTLLEQQQAALNDFVAFFTDNVRVTGQLTIGLLTTELIGNLKTSTHVINDLYVVSISNVQEFMNGLAT